MERSAKLTPECRQTRLDSTHLPLLLQSRLLLGVLQRRADGLLQRPLVLFLLLLQSRLDVDLLPHSLLRQFGVQLVDATVGVGNQGVEVVRRQFASCNAGKKQRLLVDVRWKCQQRLGLQRFINIIENVGGINYAKIDASTLALATFSLFVPDCN